MNLVLSTLFLLSTNAEPLILSHDLCHWQLKQDLAQEFLKLKNTMSRGVSPHCAVFLSNNTRKYVSEIDEEGKEE